MWGSGTCVKTLRGPEQEPADHAEPSSLTDTTVSLTESASIKREQAAAGGQQHQRGGRHLSVLFPVAVP